MRAPLRIGLVCHRGVGGSARVAVALAFELARRGHEVHLFARSVPFGVAELPAGITVHTLRDASQTPLITRLDATWSRDDMEHLVRRLIGVAESAGLDVLHFHYAVPFALALAEVRRRLGPRSPALLGTLHGTDVTGNGETPAGAELSRALSSLDALTTVSHSHAALAVRALQLPRPPQVIPNFVDTSRFRPREDGSANGGGFRIAHVSNFRHVKNPLAVARVFLARRRVGPGALWLIGDGEELNAVRTMLAHAGASEDVSFFGLRPDVEAILPSADALLLMSERESFSLVALEAAACGVPVVAPRVGGLPEVVANGRTGYLFDPGSELAAARALSRLQLAPARRRRMADAAVERARSFDGASVVPRYELLYREVLDRLRGSS